MDESFSSTINFIPLVETVPKLAVEKASFISVASRRGPPPQGVAWSRVERERRGVHHQWVIFRILELTSRNVIRGCLPLLE